MVGANGFKKASLIISGQIKRLGTSLWAMAKTSVWAMLIAGVVAVVGYFRNLREEANRIRNIFSDYKKQAAELQPSVDVSQLEALRDIAGDINRSDNDRKRALEDIAKRLNVIREKNESEINYQKRINDKIRDRIKLLEETARAEFYAQQKVSAEHEFGKLQKEMKLQGMKEGNLDYMMYNISKFKDTGSRKALQKGIDTYSDQARKPGVGFSKNYQDKLVEMSNYWQIMADSSKQLENAMANSLKLSSNTNVDDNSKKAPLQKAEEEYYASLKNYQNQLDAGAITQDKYNEGIDNLNADTVVELGEYLVSLRMQIKHTQRHCWAL